MNSPAGRGDRYGGNGNQEVWQMKKPRRQATFKPLADGIAGLTADELYTADREFEVHRFYFPSFPS